MGRTQGVAKVWDATGSDKGEEWRLELGPGAEMNPENPDSEEGGRGRGGGNMAEPGVGAFFRLMVSFLILSGGRTGSGPGPMISSSIEFG